MAKETGKKASKALLVKSLETNLTRAWVRDIAKWCSMWGVPGLESSLVISESSRMRSSLGSCRVDSGLIRVAGFLSEAKPKFVREVLCHEVAHAAAAQLHGRSAKPHGIEWQALMRAAGYEPRTRLLTEGLSQVPQEARSKNKSWEHRCPVCHMKRLAGRPVPQWRCAECLSLGLDGKLIITRIDQNGATRHA